jgi:hypothetical protein
MSAEEAQKHFEDFLLLDNLGDLRDIYFETKGKLPQFIEFYDELKAQKVGIEVLDMSMILLKLFPLIKGQYKESVYALMEINKKIASKRQVLHYFNLVKARYIRNLVRLQDQLVNLQIMCHRKFEEIQKPVRGCPTRDNDHHCQIILIHLDFSYAACQMEQTHRVSKDKFDPSIVDYEMSISKKHNLKYFEHSSPTSLSDFSSAT